VCREFRGVAGVARARRRRFVIGIDRSIKAENLFLRRQLALYIECGVKPRRIDLITRIGLTLLSHGFNWRDALVVVRPETLIRWRTSSTRLSELGGVRSSCLLSVQRSMR
jgi:hypothetical protein